jgi:hypothetical protein
VLANLRPGFRRPNGKAADPAGRVNRPVRRVEDRAVEPVREAPVELRPPLDGEAVVAQRFVLGF